MNLSKTTSVDYILLKWRFQNNVTIVVNNFGYIIINNIWYIFSLYVHVDGLMIFNSLPCYEVQ